MSDRPQGWNDRRGRGDAGTDPDATQAMPPAASGRTDGADPDGTDPDATRAMPPTSGRGDTAPPLWGPPPAPPAAPPTWDAVGRGQERPLWRSEPGAGAAPGRPGGPDVPDRTAVLPVTPPAPGELPAELSPRGTRRRPHADTAPAGMAAPAGPPPPGLRGPLRGRSRRRRWLRPWRLISLLPLLLVLYLVLLVALVATSLEKIDAFPTSGERPADSRGQTWLLVGSDSREDLSPAERKRLRTGSTAGRRTDTIMVLHVPTVGKPTLVSLPRDSYVDVPGRGKSKLNAAYAIGGAPLLVRTVEGETGLRVDHYMEIGFGGIVDMTDAVGGVDVCVPRRMVDPKAGLNIQKGCQELDGDTSLGYVRARYSDPLGDLGRIQRQQQWLSALADKISSPSVYLNPIAQVRLARSGTGAIRVDRDTGLLDLLSAARGMRAVSGGGGIVTTVPVRDPDYRRGGESFVRWDDKAAKALFDSLRAGRVPEIKLPGR